ncbi:MAG: methyltransferase domain-containing protein [Geitlerinemataceae cyanobacterium]
MTIDARTKLYQEFQQAFNLGKIDPRIPSPENNGNYDKSISSLSEYIRGHVESACLKELPYLIEKANLTPDASILDYGCGWGRLAYASSNYLSSKGLYLGLDISKFAIDSLKAGYSSFPNFEFIFQDISTDENYIYIQEGKSSKSQAKSSEPVLPIEYEGKFDVVFSHSVFTHMWREGIQHVLKEQAKVLGSGGYGINTWLIVDEYAKYVMKCGLTDRALPFFVNGVFTYSQENPLLCTAYPISTIYEIYAAAGHQIIDIEFGSWAGRENGVTYQDVVISKPF